MSGFGLVNSENVFKVCDQPQPFKVRSALDRYCLCVSTYFLFIILCRLFGVLLVLYSTTVADSKYAPLVQRAAGENARCAADHNVHVVCGLRCHRHHTDTL